MCFRQASHQHICGPNLTRDVGLHAVYMATHALSSCYAHLGPYAGEWSGVPIPLDALVFC